MAALPQLCAAPAAFASSRTRVAAVNRVARTTLGILSVIAPATIGLGLTRASFQASPSPLELFQKMLPVVRHPRCMNCHGGINPGTIAHPGGAITTETCVTCHGDTNEWSIPSVDHFFVGKSDRQLCALFANFASNMGYGPFITSHIEGDELIKLAFDGVMGGARTPGAGNPPDPPADPPPGDHSAFTRLAQDWVDQGHGACDVDGTIEQVERVDVDSVFHLSPGVTQRFQEHATRSVTVSLRDGAYVAQIETNGTTVLVLMQSITNAAGAGCTITITDSSVFSGSNSGPARVAVRDTVLFADTHPERGQTDYRVDVRLPPERTRRTDTNHLADGCGSTMQAVPPETKTTNWRAHQFTIEGHLDDRRQPRVVGGCDKVVKSAEIGRLLRLSESPCFRFPGVGNRHEPWLMHHEGSGAFPDGTDIPHQVLTTWNITYRRSP